MIKRFSVSIWFCAVMIATASLPIGAAVNNDFEDINLNVTLPTFRAGLSVGFNYDLLRSLTDVSFDYPVGYFGFNVPFGSSFNLRAVGGEPIDTIFNDENLFRNGDSFKPTVGARQNSNYTVRVDMPMIGGVGSFAYTQNFFLNYETTLGNSSLDIKPDFSGLSDDGIELNFIMKGGVSIPLRLSLGWETMTFGYAYRLDRNVVFALNLHRHLFSMDFRGRADVDLLGRFDAKIDAGPLGDLTLTQILDYPSEVANGSVQGRYTAAAWTPSVGLKLGRISLASRFGLDTKAKGSIMGQFRMPDIVDVETAKLTIDLNDDITPDDARDLINRLSSVGVDSIVYESTESMRWKLPQGHTIIAEIIPRTLSLSYTKIFGDIEMKLSNIKKSSVNREGSIWNDSLGFDLGVSVDHIMMLNLNIFGAFLNLGAFTFDIRSDENENIVGNAYKDIGLPRIGKAAVLPVLSLGATMGSKIKLHIEGDVLPLPTLRTGFFYHF